MIRNKVYNNKILMEVYKILLENLTKMMLETEFWQILQSALNSSNKTWLAIHTTTKNEH